MKKILLHTILAFILLCGAATLNGVAAQVEGVESTGTAEPKVKEEIVQTAAVEDNNAVNDGGQTRNHNSSKAKKSTATTTNQPNPAPKIFKNDTIKLTIHQDTTIIFSNISEVKDKKVVIWGDDAQNKDYASDDEVLKFMKDFNSNHSGIKPILDTSDTVKRVAIEIEYYKIKDSDEYKVLTTKKIGKQWQKDYPIYLKIIKGKSVQAITIDSELQDLDSSLEDIQAKTESNNGDLKEIVLEIVLLVLVLLALTASVVSFLKMKGLYNEVKELRDNLSKTKKDFNSQVYSGTNDTRIGEIARREANNAVQTLRNELNQALRSNSYQQQQTQPLNNQATQPFPQHSQQADIDTTDVEYNANENTFILKPTKIHHIRIFSQNGCYYFCLSHNVIGNELASQVWIGSIKTYERCIQYTMKNLNSTRINIVQNGELRKESDRFVVVKKMVIELL